jgi:hypothetical protein
MPSLMLSSVRTTCEFLSICSVSNVSVCVSVHFNAEAVMARDRQHERNKQYENNNDIMAEDE